jgi:histidine triad (HIT) family protein
VPDCKFCRIDPAVIVHETAECLVFLDYRPVFPGHCLVIPKEHCETLADLRAGLIQPLFRETQRVARALETALGADGSFVAINNKVSQSVPHLHVHVVPRRRKDGLRGFFWPRQSYRDETHMAEVRDLLREALQQPGTLQ